MLKTTTNDQEITSEGYNYLKERQINRVKRKQVEFKKEESSNIENTSNNAIFSLNETLKNFYETRIEEMKQNYENQLNEQKKQIEYFKTLYEEEKSERIKTNAQYQTYLLGTAEDNKKPWSQLWTNSNKEN